MALKHRQTMLLKKPASYESSLELAVHFNAIVIPNFLLSLDIASL